MNRSDELELNMTIKVIYDYEEGTEEHFDQGFGNWLPGDPDTLTITDVLLESEDGKTSVSILGCLTRKQLETIANDLEDAIYNN